MYMFPEPLRHRCRLGLFALSPNAPASKVVTPAATNLPKSSTAARPLVLSVSLEPLLRGDQRRRRRCREQVLLRAVSINYARDYTGAAHRTPRS